MAEAVIEDRPQQPQKRFYCHICSREIESLTNEYMCPHCYKGFVEEIPITNNDSNVSSDMEMLENDRIVLESDPYADFNNRLTDEISTLFMSVAENRSQLDDDDGVQNPNNTGANTGSRRRRLAPRLGVSPFNSSIDNVIHDLIISVTSGAGGVPSGSTPMYFMGNPGDYAWGREGLDAIITQLLNQMESTGPPPLPKDQIQEIPKVEITQDQVDIKLQCSVCWENFQLNEIVRKLSCSHLYHENCIVPWLELHGTCPVCRKSFVPELTEEQHRNQFTAAAANSIRNVAAFMRPESNDASTSTANENASSSHNPSQLATVFLNAFNSIPQQQQQQQQQQQPPQNSNNSNNQQNNSNGTSNNRRSNSDRDSDGIVEYEFD